MGLRFRKSIKILPGVKLNLNQNSHSWTFGGKGAHFTVNKKTGKATQTMDLPGGFHYAEQKNINSAKPNADKPRAKNKPFYKRKWFIALCIIIVLGIIGNITK